MNDHVLDEPIFGLAGYQLTSDDSPTAGDEMESQLGAFERLMLRRGMAVNAGLRVRADSSKS